MEGARFKYGGKLRDSWRRGRRRVESNQADGTEIGIRADLGLGGMARVGKAVKVSRTGKLGKDEQRGGKESREATGSGLCGAALDAQIT